MENNFFQFFLNMFRHWRCTLHMAVLSHWPFTMTAQQRKGGWYRRFWNPGIAKRWGGVSPLPRLLVFKSYLKVTCPHIKDRCPPKVVIFHKGWPFTLNMSTYIEIVLILQNCVTFTRIVLSVVSAKLGGGGLKAIFAMPRRQKTKTKKARQDI